MYEPKWWPKGWRKIGLNECIKEGDFYWSPRKHCWFPVLMDEFLGRRPVIRRTTKSYIQVIEDVRDGRITGTFAENPELYAACRWVVSILENVPIIISMIAQGCASGEFNDWPQLKPGCCDVAKAISMRPNFEKR